VGVRLPVRIGFAAETHDVIEHARAKLVSKDLDLIVANAVAQPDGGPGSDFNEVTLLAPNGAPEALPRLPKAMLAELLCDRAAALLASARDAAPS
jgi:phosphopantothenoylcysteine decarboxylase/phosphopantothenate--cysteine ligase